MRIGIDASRAFSKERTGIEEYSYQVVKSLKDKLIGHQVILYLREEQLVDFNLPINWRIKNIKWPYFWTQIGLSLEMLLHPVDVLFVPSHVIPFIHPKKTIVTVHGLEYEVLPKAYSAWERLYMRLSIRKSCLWASRIIAVSENTKKDLMRVYSVPIDKIKVIYEGVNENFRSEILNDKIKAKHQLLDTKYLLFIGRLEERKNINGIISAFETLKEQYHIPHKLILAGRFGYGEKLICHRLSAGKFSKDITCLGFVSDEEKWALLDEADIFLFATFYEGFGLPILEAQQLGVPVVASSTSSLPEVGAEAAVYCDPSEPVSIAEAIYAIIKDPARRKELIEKGYENVKRFSWDKCAEEIAALLVEDVVT